MYQVGCSQTHPMAHGQELLPVKRPVDRLRAVGDESPQLAGAQDASRGYGHPGMAILFDACTKSLEEAFLYRLNL